MPAVTALNIFPVKSLQGIALARAKLGVRGLEYDRNWMITDAGYHFVTQRQIAKMASVQVSITATQIILASADKAPLKIDLRHEIKNIVRAIVWKDSCEAQDEGEEAAEWLSDVLGSKQYPSLRLIRFHPECIRTVETDYLRDEEAHTAFSDAYPFLLTAEESLAKLNKNLRDKGAEKITMNRFRPNIVVCGLEPFAEDVLDNLQHESGFYKLGLRKPCQRCKITTVDQKTGRITDHKEPLNTLANMNQSTERPGAFFGQNAILVDGNGATISIGDRLLS